MWINVVVATRIMLVDKEIASSDIAKAGIKLAKPAGINLSILNKQKTIHNINDGRYDAHKVLKNIVKVTEKVGLGF